MNEEEKIEFYADAMGATPEKARAHLIKHNWDVDAAFSDDPSIKEARPGPAPRAQTPGPASDSRMSRSLITIHSTTRQNSPAPENDTQRDSSIPSLMSADDEMARVLELSLKESQAEVAPRPLHPEWSQVSSNVPPETSAGISQADQDYEQAIQLSLVDSQQADDKMDVPVGPKIRQDARPLAVRSQSPELTFAAMLVQGIFYLPQVRETISNCRINTRGTGSIHEEDDNAVVSALLECFVWMDISVSVDLRPLEMVLEIIVLPQYRDRSPPLATRKLLDTLIPAIEHVVTRQLNLNQENEPHSEQLRSHLFTFSYSKPSQTTMTWNSIVEIDPCPYPGLNESNDLMSTLSMKFTDAMHPEDNFVIHQHSTAIIFQINEPLRHSDSRSNSKRFQFPARMFLDRWMASNIELANSKRARQEELQVEIQKLRARRSDLTHSVGGPSRDVFKDMRATIFYYSIAPDHGDHQRREQLDIVKGKLERILKHLEESVAEIDRNMELLQLESNGLFDVPELQRLEYNLRVVLMHDGMIGRKHLYSYVNNRGTWWKTLDHDVSQVSEDVVLSDPNGMHMGAGPYLLMYSRAIPNEENIVPPPLHWPQLLREGVKTANREALADQPEDIVDSAYGSKSPEASPRIMELITAEELTTTDDDMDTTSG